MSNPDRQERFEKQCKECHEDGTLIYKSGCALRPLDKPLMDDMFLPCLDNDVNPCPRLDQPAEFTETAVGEFQPAEPKGECFVFLDDTRTRPFHVRVYGGKLWLFRWTKAKEWVTQRQVSLAEAREFKKRALPLEQANLYCRDKGICPLADKETALVEFNATHPPEPTNAKA